MSETKPVTDESTAKRDRSPNYPSLTWSEALTAVKKIWDKEKRHATSLDIASKHLGYKRKNGISLPMIAAMKRYGLLVQVGSDVRVSDEANAVLLYPEGSKERAEITKKLVMMPELFGRVLAKFPDGLPSDDNLLARLQHEWGFANPKAAEKFIKSLKEAVAIAGDGVASGGGSVDNEVNATIEAHMSTPTETTIKPNSPVVTGQGTATGTSTASAVGRVSAPVGTQARPWDLGGGVTMVAVLPNKLTKLNIARLKRYVQALEMEASISWDTETESEEGNETS